AVCLVARRNRIGTGRGARFSEPVRTGGAHARAVRQNHWIFPGRLFGGQHVWAVADWTVLQIARPSGDGAGGGAELVRRFGDCRASPLTSGSRLGRRLERLSNACTDQYRER